MGAGVWLIGRLSWGFLWGLWWWTGERVRRMWRVSVLWVCISRRGGLRLKRGENAEPSLVGDEIGFGPWFRSLPAGLGRWKPGKATPRKRSAGRSARSRPGKTQPFFPPSHPGRCKPPAKMLCTVDGPSRHGDHMHVEHCIGGENHNPGRLQLKICSVLHLPAGSMQRAADRVVSFRQPLPLRTLRLDRTRPESYVVRTTSHASHQWRASHLEGLSLTTVCPENMKQKHTHISHVHLMAPDIRRRLSRAPSTPRVRHSPCQIDEPPPNLVFQPTQYSPQGSITRIDAQLSLAFMPATSVLENIRNEVQRRSG